MKSLPRWATAPVGVAAVLLAGCQNPYAGKTQLRYMAWGNVQQLEIEQRLIDRFNQLNPDLHVELFKVPQSAYGNKAIVMFASRTAPDVVRIDHYNFPQLAARNYFYDITDLAAKDPEFRESDFYPGAMSENRINGRLLGLNVLFGGGVVIYNKTLLKREGLADPYVLSQRGEWTTDRLREYAQRLTKRDQSGRTTQFGVGHPGFPFYIGLMYGFGASILNDDMTRCTLDQPEAAQALRYVSDLRWRYRVCPSPSQGADSAFSFESGKLGMEFNYIGMTARYRDKIRDFDWDICPMPRGPKDESLFVKGNQLTMPRDTRHPNEAWRLMKFMTGEEAERLLYLQERRQAPTRIKLAESEEFRSPKQPPFNMQVVLDNVRRGRTLPISERFPEVSQALGAEMDNLFAGRERDAAVAAKRATERINKILSEDPGL